LPNAYSPTPLHRKLGLKPELRTLLLDHPPNYFLLLGPDAPVFTPLPLSSPPFDLIHVFVTTRRDLEQHIPFLRTTLVSDGSIWVSWPKKSSHVESDVSEDTVREIALANDLVDVKVCSVDSTWSGLKLVIPRALRANHPVT